MASTRFINAPCDYKLQQDRKSNIANYLTYKYSGEAYTNNTPGFNILPGQVGPTSLAYNYADVDSYLKGTYTNNLENPRREFTPRLKKPAQLNFFKTSEVYLPKSLVIENCMRPNLS